MKSSEAAAFLPIIKAYGEGKTIQFKIDNKWVNQMDGISFAYEVDRYRIKPEPVEVKAFVNSEGKYWGKLSDVESDKLKVGDIYNGMRVALFREVTA